MTYSLVDYADVQGLVHFGYKHLTRATYALVRVRNVVAARFWLLAAPVSNAEEKKPPPATALQVAFTAPGLQALAVADSVLAGFSREFLTGMTREYRSRMLGDVGSNAPEYWDWGDPERENEPHLLVMFFGEPDRFDAFVQGLTGDAWHEAFKEVSWLATEDLNGVEPFGFADGISQPKIDWDLKRKPPPTQYEYSNEVALGEFLLGYRNEYGKTTDRPLLDPAGLPQFIKVRGGAYFFLPSLRALRYFAGIGDR